MCHSFSIPCKLIEVNNEISVLIEMAALKSIETLFQSSG